MNKSPTVQIDPDFKELIPSFMKNSFEEIEEMFTAVEKSDFTTLKRLGHSTKGAGRGYGFNDIGEIGLKIETAADQQNIYLLKTSINDLVNYLNQVKIVFE